MVLRPGSARGNRNNTGQRSGTGLGRRSRPLEPDGFLHSAIYLNEHELDPVPETLGHVLDGLINLYLVATTFSNSSSKNREPKSVFGSSIGCESACSERRIELHRPGHWGDPD